MIPEEKTGEVKIEYVFNPELGGVENVISAEKGAVINGRVLTLADGTTFSVADIQGRVLATDVESWNFTSEGICVISTSAGSMKVVIR